MIVLTNKKLFAQEFVEYATGKYFLKCFTLKEMHQCYWQGCKTPISNYWKLTEIDRIPKTAYVALVEVSKEDNYMGSEVYFVRLHKKFVNKFKENILKGTEK